MERRTMPLRTAADDAPAAPPWADCAVAAACAVPIAAGGLTGPVLPTVLLLVACTGLAWRRVRPTASALVVGAAIVGAWSSDALHATDPSTWTIVAGGALATASTFAAVAYGPRWVAWAALPAALGAAVAGGAAAGGLALTQEMIAALAVASLAWTLGQWRHSQRDYVASLLERVERAEREQAQRAQLVLAHERARIARELHDVVAHSLAVMTAQADGARYVLDAAPEAAAEALRTIADTGRTTMRDMRDLLGVLTDDGAGPPASWQPQPGVADLEELVGAVRSSGIDAALRIEGAPSGLPPGTQLAVYRLVQEALTNVLKHAGPGTGAEVALRWSDGELRVRVSDDGAGADGAGPRAARDHAATDAPVGRGLVGMRERMAQLGGTVAFEQRPEGGFVVAASVPLVAADRSLTEPAR